MSALVIFGLLGLYALMVFFVFRPRQKLLTSLILWTAISIAATGGIIAGAIHLSRFILSPQSELPWSLVLALLYLLAGASAYGMLLWYVWSLWRKRKIKE
jgi:hypothetical protein